MLAPVCSLGLPGVNATIAPVLAAPTNDKFCTRHPLSTWNMSLPTFNGTICVFLRSSPSTDTFLGRSIGLFSGYTPVVTLIVIPALHTVAALPTVLFASVIFLPLLTSSPSSHTNIILNSELAAPTHLSSPSSLTPSTDPAAPTLALLSKNVPPI